MSVSGFRDLSMDDWSKIQWFFHDVFTFCKFQEVFVKFNNFWHRSEFQWFFNSWGNPAPPHGTEVKDWVWIWDSEKLLKSTKAATFHACIIGKICTQTTSSLRSLLLQFSHHTQSTYKWISDLHSCIYSSVCKQSCNRIWAYICKDVMIMIVTAWQRSEGLGLRMGFRAIESEQGQLKHLQFISVYLIAIWLM